MVASLVVFLAIGVGPHTNRYRTLSVLTGSMEPVMPVGSMIVATPVSVGDLRVGDIVAYQAPIEDHRVVTHRVVKIVRAGGAVAIQTKGDANSSPDPWMAKVESPVVWRVRMVVPLAGSWIHALRSPLVSKTLVLAVPFVLAVLWLAQIWGAPPRRGAPVLKPYG